MTRYASQSDFVRYAIIDMNEKKKFQPKVEMNERLEKVEFRKIDGEIWGVWIESAGLIKALTVIAADKKFSKKTGNKWRQVEIEFPVGRWNIRVLLDQSEILHGHRRRNDSHVNTDMFGEFRFDEEKTQPSIKSWISAGTEAAKIKILKENCAHK